MNRRSFLARFVGGLAAISMRLEMPKVEEPMRLMATDPGASIDEWIIVDFEGYDDKGNCYLTIVKP